MLVFFNEDGWIGRVSADTPTARRYAKTSGLDFIEVAEAPSDNAYVDLKDRVVVEPERLPSAAHYIDPKTKDVKVDLDEAKRLKWKEIKAQRDKAEHGGFSCFGKRFDSDHKSQQRIVLTAMLGATVDFTTADNEVVELTSRQLVELSLVLSQHVTKIHSRARLLRARIEAAKSLADLEAIVWTNFTT